MSKLILLSLLVFISLSLTAPTNCNVDMAMQVLEVEDITDILSMDDIAKCADADLCRIDCKTISGKKDRLVMMKVDLHDPKISDQMKNAYYQNCAWELERVEILTDMSLKPAKGRGQIISQYIAQIGRLNREKLPAQPKFPKRKYFNKSTKRGGGLDHASSTGRQPIRGKAASTIGHANSVDGGTSRKPVGPKGQHPVPVQAGSLTHKGAVDSKNAYGVVKGKYEGEWITPTGRVIWTPTVRVMQDWVDYLIYASNQFTFFKDLCKKTGNIDETAKKFKFHLIEDGKKGISALYAVGVDRLNIESFIVSSAALITTKFVEIYKNPHNTCSCLEIVKSLKPSSETKKFTSTMSGSCPNIEKTTKEIKIPEVKTPIKIPTKKPVKPARPVKIPIVHKKPSFNPVIPTKKPVVTRTPPSRPERDDDDDDDEDDGNRRDREYNNDHDDDEDDDNRRFRSHRYRRD